MADGSHAYEQTLEVPLRRCAGPAPHHGGGALAKEETARVVQQRTMDNEALEA